MPFLLQVQVKSQSQNRYNITSVIFKPPRTTLPLETELEKVDLDLYTRRVKFKPFSSMLKIYEYDRCKSKFCLYFVNLQSGYTS